MPSLSLLLLSVLFISLGPSQSQQVDETVLVCSVSVIPYGYVIIGKTSTEQCRINNDLPERDNTLMIKKPGVRETICEKSPYPSNYAVVGRARLNTCPNTGNESDNNAWVITRLK